MRSVQTERKTTREQKGIMISQEAAMKNAFNAMTIDEIRNSKPKSRLESFLRRKALEKRDRDKLFYR